MLVVPLEGDYEPLFAELLVLGASLGLVGGDFELLAELVEVFAERSQAELFEGGPQQLEP